MSNVQTFRQKNKVYLLFLSSKESSNTISIDIKRKIKVEEKQADRARSFSKVIKLKDVYFEIEA